MGLFTGVMYYADSAGSLRLSLGADGAVLPGIQSQEVGSPLVVHVLIIGFLIVVTFHLLFPIIEPMRRQMLVWRFTQGTLTAKSLYVLGFGLIVSMSIALWDQLLLLLAKHDVVRFYLMVPRPVRPRRAGARD